MPGAVSICFMRSNDPSSERYLNAFVSRHLPHVFGSPVLNHPISKKNEFLTGWSVLGSGVRGSLLVYFLPGK